LTAKPPRVLCVFLLAAFVAGCSHHSDLRKPAAQDDFGVKMAQMNLWREAMFRFKRAVEINPTDAMAHNNLAVAYEANGDFEQARKEYLEALKLDRSNQYIQKNYSRFVEFLSRNRKRQPKETKTAAAAPEKPPLTTPAVDASQPAPPATASAPQGTPATTPPATTPPTTTQPKPPGGER
jgi:Tfp pilus assembly protein PilF